MPALDPTMLTVVLGRFDQIVRNGLTDALREDPKIRVIASDLQDAALEEVVAREAPHVLILDEAIADSLLGRLKASQPDTEVVVLASNLTLLYRTLLRSAGVRLLTLSASTAEILATVSMSRHSERSPPSGRRYQAQPRRLGGLDLLTPRERGVLDCLVRGMSYGEIADALQPALAPETVRTHTRAICRKLDLSRRALIGLELDSKSDSPG
jgi:DNA-binding NarL/FixJ family response regulator